MAKMSVKSHYKVIVRKRFDELAFGQVFIGSRSGEREFYMKLHTMPRDADNAIGLKYYTVVTFQPQRIVTPVKAKLDIEYEL